MRMHIDADEIAALGVSLLDLADALAAQGDSGQDTWAFGEGRAAASFTELVGAWQRERLRVCRGLADLGEAAAFVGGLYVDTEERNRQSLVGGVW